MLPSRCATDTRTCPRVPPHGRGRLPPPPQCTDLTDLERLTRQYNKQVNTLMATCMELELFNVLSELLKPWLRHCTTLATEAGGDAAAALLSPLHSVMHGVLQFTVNLLNYSTTHGKKFRHHLAVDSDVIAEVRPAVG